MAPAIGYAFSAACLIWVFWGVDIGQILNDFASLDWRYVTIAVIFDLGVYVCHGWRWSIVLQPVARTSVWRSIQAVYIGLFVNEVLPLRPGELIRCYLASHWNRITLSLALASAAIERLMDGFWLVLAFVLTATRMPGLPPYLQDGAQVMGIALCVLTGLLIYIVSRRAWLENAIRQHRWSGPIQHLLEGLSAMGNKKTMIAAAGASLLYLVLQIVPIWALAEGYGIGLSVWASAVVLVILRLGTVIPNAPGNVGSFQFFVVLSLGLFGVDKTTAAGFSLMMFGVLTLPLLIGGLIAVLLSGLNLEEVRKRAHRTLHGPVVAGEN
ncbi:MAG: lysylphosphatidylglycerol synthase transmembrane domain-containing protein [Bryobacteraceae bacterium]